MIIFFDILDLKLRNQAALLSYFQVHDTKQIANDVRELLLREQSLEKYLINFQLLIEQKIEGFTGRKWLFDEVEEFIFKRENKSGYFFILGDPGIGKSALAAKLVSERAWVCHFNLRREGINQAKHFLVNIYAQLIIKNSLDPAPYIPIETSNSGTLEKIFLDLQLLAVYRNDIAISSSTLPGTRSHTVQRLAILQ